MAFEIKFYSEKIEAQITSLPRTLLARFFTLVDRMQENGPNLGEPHTRAMGSGLFELRLKGAEGIARVFYCTVVGRRVVMLHSFLKKSEDTPPYELEVARTRLLEVKRDYVL